MPRGWPYGCSYGSTLRSSPGFRKLTRVADNLTSLQTRSQGDPRGHHQYLCVYHHRPCRVHNEAPRCGEIHAACVTINIDAEKAVSDADEKVHKAEPLSEVELPTGDAGGNLKTAEDLQEFY